MMYFGDPLQQHTKDPAVVRFDDRYWLYYTSIGNGKTGISIATSQDMERWHVIGKLAPEGNIEAKGIAAPGAIVLAGRIHLFYQSYGNGTDDAILHAWSSDGTTFHRNQNPVLKPTGTWNCGRAIDADVIPVGAFLHMYWATRDPGMTRQMVGLSRARLDSDFGPDSWEQVSTNSPTLSPGVPTPDDSPDLDLAWEQDCIEAPAMLEHDGTFYMFYGGAYNNAPQQIGIASSEDGIRFRRLNQGQPLMRCGDPDAWNSSEVGHPFAFKDRDGSDYLFFQGNSIPNAFPWHISQSRIEWEKRQSGTVAVPRLPISNRHGKLPTPVLLSSLASPIIFAGNAKTAYRDPAVLYHDGFFHLFCTCIITETDGRGLSYTIQSRSTDLINWTAPATLTPGDPALNFGSPGNVVRHGDEWVLCLQTYPRPDGEKYGNENARIWTMRSRDLKTWDEPELLRVKGPGVARKDMGRMIDPYLLEDTREPGKWWCFFKQNGVSFSSSRNLCDWTYHGHIDGGENVCVLPVDDGRYVMFHSPANGIGIKYSTDMRHWEDADLITLGQDHWPWAQGRLTAGFVLDMRADSRILNYIMFFHGSGPEDEHTIFDTYCSIGVAWSPDLKKWHWPGHV